MELFGKSPINPILFYSGKISGYIIWAIFILLFFNVDIITVNMISYNQFIAYGLFSIGLLFALISLLNLGQSTRFGLPATDTRLKTKGLYKLSRNPMYFGFNLITLASMIYTMNVIIILLGIYCVIVYHLIILGEEQFLTKRFGENYLGYKRQVRRYL